MTLFIALAWGFAGVQLIGLLSVLIPDLIEQHKHKVWLKEQNRIANMPRLERLEYELKQLMEGVYHV